MLFDRLQKRDRKDQKNRKGQKDPAGSFDRERERAVLHVSICTGETVAGFEDKESHAFRDVCLIRGEGDLESFRREYGIGEDEEIPKVY